MCCQVEFDEQGREIGRKRSRRIRKNREAKRQTARKKPTKVDAEMQTVPEDYWLCPWCNEHIAPAAQCGHEAMCRAGVQQKQLELELKNRLAERNRKAEIRRLQRLGLPPPKIDKEMKKRFGNETHPKAPALSTRSRSRNRIANGEKPNKDKNDANRLRSPRPPSQSDHKQNSVIAKLDDVHPNDLEAMAKLMQRLCSEPKCSLLADSDHPATRTGIKCHQCKHIYCALHRPIGKHATCPIAVDHNDNDTSVACGWDPEEKKAALKSAMREKKAQLRELRMRN